MSGFLSSMVGATYGPPASTYAVAAAGGATSVNEGSSLTFNVTTTDVADSTTLFYTVSANSGDFGTSSGSFSITSNAGSFSLTPTADVTTEGSETFAAQVRTGSTAGTVVATSGTITILDSSITPTLYTVSHLAQSTSASTSALPLPTGTAVGDLVIYCCNRSASGQNLPTGWSLIAGDSNNPVYAFWSYKIMTAGDISTGSISHTGSTSSIRSKFAVTFRGNQAITAANYSGFVQSTLTGSSNSVASANQSFVNKDLGLILLSKASATALSNLRWSDSSGILLTDDNGNNYLYYLFLTGTVTKVGTTTSWSSSTQYVQHRLKIPLV